MKLGLHNYDWDDVVNGMAGFTWFYHGFYHMIAIPTRGLDMIHYQSLSDEYYRLSNYGSATHLAIPYIGSYILLYWLLNVQSAVNPVWL